MTTTTQHALSKLLAFLDRLEQANIAYGLKHVRDTIMVVISVPGERWEVEFFEDGEIEIERFVSTGVTDIDEGSLEHLIHAYNE